MKGLDAAQLYGFVDSAYLNGRKPAELAKSLCEGGVDLIQWRAKGWAVDQVEEVAKELIRITRDHGIPLVINDHLKVALEVGAEYCHLGQEDFFDAGYRKVSDLPLGTSEIGIGLSTHAPEQAARALEADPAYIAIGPVFATGTKPTAKPVTLDYVRWASANAGTVPWFAIGGINENTIQQVLNSGARRICIVSAILNASDPAAKCREFLRLINES